jgi:hypothetical protein
MCALRLLLVLGVFHHPGRGSDEAPNWIANNRVVVNEAVKASTIAEPTAGRSDKDVTMEMAILGTTTRVDPKSKTLIKLQGPGLSEVRRTDSVKSLCTCGLGWMCTQSIGVMRWHSPGW